MKRLLLLGYQLLTGLSDASTGILLLAAPAATLQLMRLHVPLEALPFISYIGVFVLSVGVACLYGALLVRRSAATQKLEVVWLLTAITRGLVALFVLAKILSGGLETGWITVALTDGIFAALQSIGLMQGWLHDINS
jgi:hypothetical protein